MENVVLQTKVNISKEKNVVSHRQAVAMVSKQVATSKNKRIYNHFTKEMLLNLLSENDCQGINFYFGLNEEGKNTLIAVPTGNDQQNLKVLAADGSIQTTQKLMVGESPYDCKL
jgi:hypothetical protein